MSSPAELDELHALVSGLRRCVGSLRSRFGENPATRRLALDAERILHDVELLDYDANELNLDQYTARPVVEKIVVPDTQYDSEFWRDIDDEGVGGHHR